MIFSKEKKIFMAPFGKYLQLKVEIAKIRTR
jgi:hypothetical protein